MLSAGDYRHSVRFERRGENPIDGYGNPVRDWVPIMTVRAAFLPRFGRETVASGRLESTFTGTLTVRSWPGSQDITAADAIVFAEGPYAGRKANIRSIVPSPDGHEIEMVIEEGVAL